MSIHTCAIIKHFNALFPFVWNAETSCTVHNTTLAHTVTFYKATYMHMYWKGADNVAPCYNF